MTFVDSSYIIALADKKDQWHEKSQEIFTPMTLWQ